MPKKRVEKYPIISDLEMPPPIAKRDYPYADLNIGECFLVDFDDKKELHRIRVATDYMNKKNGGGGKKWSCRRIPGTETQVGIWRLS